MVEICEIQGAQHASFKEKLRSPSRPRAKVNWERTTGHCISTPGELMDDNSTAKNSLPLSEPSAVYVVLILPL